MENKNYNSTCMWGHGELKTDPSRKEWLARTQSAMGSAAANKVEGKVKLSVNTIHQWCMMNIDLIHSIIHDSMDRSILSLGRASVLFCFPSRPPLPSPRIAFQFGALKSTSEVGGTVSWSCQSTPFFVAIFLLFSFPYLSINREIRETSVTLMHASLV